MNKDMGLDVGDFSREDTSNRERDEVEESGHNQW